MKNLEQKSKDELIEYIKLLQSKIDNVNLYFPGFGVINKYEKINTQTIDKYRLMFQKSNDAILVLKKNIVTECNFKSESVFGIHKEHIIGKFLYDFTPMIQPDGSNSKEKIHQFLKESNSKHQQIPLQIKMLKNGLNLFDAELNFSEFTIDEDTFVYLVIRDVSERMELSRQLKDEYEKRIEEQDLTQSGNWEFNANNFDVYWSPSAYAIHDLSRHIKAPTLNEYFAQYVHPDEHDILFQAIQESIRTGHNFSMDYKIRTKNQKMKYLHVKGKAVYQLNGEVDKVVGTVVDITERKLLEIKLNDSKEQYQNLIEKLPEGVIIYNLQKILYANISAFQIPKVNSLKEDCSAYSIFDFILPQYKNEVERKIKFLIEGKSLGTVEMRIKNAEGKIIDIEVRSNPVVHNGEVAIQAIFSEITYRKYVERKLRESERRLSTLIGNLQGMVYRCKNDPSWTMEFVSDGCLELTGYDREAMLNNTSIHYSELILDEDRESVWQKVQEAVSERRVFTLSYRIRTKNGTIKWLHEQGKGIFDDQNKLLALEGFITDVSREKYAEIALKERYNDYKNIVDFVPEGMLIHKHGTIVFANQVALGIFGYNTNDELKGLSMMNFILPEFHEKVKKRVEGSYKGMPQTFTEIKVYTRNGGVLEVETRSIPFVYENEQCVLVAVHAIDAQKQLAKETIRAKLAEEANEALKKEIEQKVIAQNELITSQNYVKNIINSSLDMIIASDRNNKVTEFNKAAQIVYGYKESEIIGQELSVLTSAPEVLLKVQDVLHKEGYFSGEVLNIRKNGELFDCFLTATLLLNEKGEVIGSMGVSRDLTKLKKDRERFHLSEERYKAIFNQVFVGIARLDISGKFTQVNQRFCTILGYTEEELLELYFQDKSVEHTVNGFENLLDYLIRKKINDYTFEQNYYHKDGHIVNTQINISLVLSANNSPMYFVLVCADITENKRNHELALKQTAKLNSLIESSNYMVMAIDKKERLTTFNSNTTKFIKEFYGIEALVGLEMTKGSLVSSVKANQFWIKRVKETLKGKSQFFEYVAFDKEGQQKNFEFYLTPVRSAENIINEVAIVGYDITEKKKIEEKIINQGAKLSAIFENSSHQIYTIDKLFKLTSFNELFAKTLYKDYGLEATLGMNLKKEAQVQMPVSYFKNFVKLHKSALKGNAIRVESKVKDTKERTSYYMFYLDPIVLPDGKINEVSYIAHDITDKKLAEKSIVESLKEKEILLKEVHHRVKNNLQVISSILNLQSAYHKDKNTVNLFRELQNRVRTMSFIHESLYQTSDFSNLNFRVYLENLIANLMHSYMIDNNQIEVQFDCDNLFLNLDFSIPCGLIINELISNALKYAFNDNQKGVIRISVKKLKNKVTFVVADNGKGIAPEIDIRNTETLGLQLVVSLVDQIYGKLFYKDLNPGTKIKFTFELKS